MNIQINTDHNIDGNERLQAYIKSKITDALKRFENQITRVEIHLSDENAGKTGLDDKRCLLEARLEGHEPLSVTANADTIENALNSATDKIKRVLETVVGKLRH